MMTKSRRQYSDFYNVYAFDRDVGKMPRRPYNSKFDEFLEYLPSCWTARRALYFNRFHLNRACLQLD